MVSEKALEVAERVLTEKEKETRCIKARICPRCAETLRFDMDEKGFKDLRCISCSYVKYLN